MSEITTYNQLTDTLSLLGFRAETKEAFVVLRNDDYDALIVLPIANAESSVPHQHLVAARETVAGKGVSDKQNFDRLLSLSREQLAKRSQEA